MKKPMLGRDESTKSRARLLPWLVLFLSLLTTGVLYGSIDQANHRRNALEFGREVTRVRQAAAGAIRRQVAVLQATAGAIAANPHMSRSQFAAFYRHLSSGEDARNLEGLGLSLARPWSRRRELAQEAARRGVHPYTLQPKAPRPEADAIILLEPLEARNATAAGFDMHAEAERRKAIDRALTTGRASMTSKVYLAKDRGAHIPSFVFYLPVQDSEGLVFSTIHAARLFRDIFADQPTDYAGEVGVKIWTGEPNEANLVFDNNFRARTSDHSVGEVRFPEGGRTLTIGVLASPNFGSTPRVRPFILPGGLIASLLLFVLASNLVSAREESERRESEQALLAEVGRLTVESTEFGDETLRSIAAATAMTFDAVCRIDLFDTDGSLRTMSTRTDRSEAVAALEAEYPRERSDPLFRRALETGRPQRAAHYEAIDARHQALIDELGGGPIMIVPFRIGERAIGAMTLVRSTGRPGFSAEAAALGEAIAGRLALALDNARLYHDLERRVEERTRDLEASNHELESFCYSVSHDLRTPLRSVDGFGRVLKEDYGDRLDEQGQDYVNRILAAAKRMDELITALLTLSRLTRREIVPTEVDVTRMVEDQLLDLDPDRRVHATVEPGIRIHADSRMIAVLFDNLLSNAIKFSSRKEEPTMTVGKSDGWLFVRDNGAGFDMAYANKLFQPFERLHSPREFPGHGIGLATVERIVRRHGGDVRAEGRPGEGATIYVRFPE